MINEINYENLKNGFKKIEFYFAKTKTKNQKIIISSEKIYFSLQN